MTGFCVVDKILLPAALRVLEASAKAQLVTLSQPIYDFHQLRENENGTFVVERKTCVNTTEPGQLPNLVETISTVVWSETKGAAETAMRNADERLGSAYKPYLRSE